MPEQEPSTRSNGVLHRRNSSMPDFPDAIKGPRFIPAFKGGVSARQRDDLSNFKRLSSFAFAKKKNARLEMRIAQTELDALREEAEKRGIPPFAAGPYLHRARLAPGSGSPCSIENRMAPLASWNCRQKGCRRTCDQHRPCRDPLIVHLAQCILQGAAWLADIVATKTERLAVRPSGGVSVQGICPHSIVRQYVLH